MEKEPVFSSLEQSTSFKRQLNQFTIFETGFADLNAALIDAYIVNQYKITGAFKYGILKLGWIFSKLFKKQKKHTQKTILLVPSEPGKDRSIGLYKPILSHLCENDYDLIGIDGMLSGIKLYIFFKWLLKIPAITRAALKTTNNEDLVFLKEIKWLLVIDTVIHYLWIMQLRSFFKRSAYKSVLVDWDRHKFQSLLVLAARQAKIETFTFVHGAIYTAEKFVPLIADKCLIWGNNHLEFFTSLEEEKSRLVKAGSTRFDTTLPEKKIILEKYKIDGRKKIILHPSQNFPDLQDHVIIEDLQRFLVANDHFRLAIKFHPSQDNATLKKKLSGLGDMILLDEAVTAKEALAIADFAVIVSSTFCVDAMIAGVPVALYKPGNVFRGIAVDLAQKAGAPVLQTKEDFKRLLDAAAVMPASTCFNMSAQKNFIKDYCEFYGDESAALIAGILVK